MSKRTDNKDILWKVYLIYIGFIVLVFVILGKTFTIQSEGVRMVLSGSNGKEKIPTRTVERLPRRGEILDIHHTPLVTSVSFFDIHMDATVVNQEVFDRDISDLCQKLSSLYPRMTAREYESQIRKARKRGNRYLLIKKRATNEERNKLRDMPIFKLGRNRGGLIDTEETILRKRPHGELLKRTLGYYQKSDGEELRVGIEGAFHNYLAGEPGLEIEQHISTGWKKTGQIVKDAVEGASIVTSIDKEIQEVAHTELYRQLEKTNAQSGSVIVMDVKTGFVKAIVNLSKAGDNNYYESYNHAIGTKEVPGSTFKLASLMAALEDQKISIHDTVTAAPRYTYYESTLNESHNNNYGRITIQRAFELSSNVISKVIYRAYKNEPQTYIDRLRSFGLNQALGLDLQGEPTPTLYSPGSPNWSGISLPWMSVGYEVQLTPMQILAFYNAVANNGRMVKPQFVQEIIRGTESVKQFAPITLKEKICSDRTLTALQSCLEGVMKRGTGRRLTSSYFDIAGKTGTAEILNDDMRYGARGEKKYLASFVGYFPAKEPLYSCIVSISASGEHIYGATVSGTVFAAIANKVYAGSLKYHQAINEARERNFGAPLSKDGNRYDLNVVLKNLGVQVDEKNQGEYVRTKSTEKNVEFHERFVGKKTIPNVVGMTAKDAVYLIERTGMKAQISGYGKVFSQNTAPGGEVIPGQLIQLVLKP
ncbi:MAG: PASTA domain-containing protein [Bacteroidetes bacterium]|nr:MAG: PASTA domain-containing protein [Bacteroidota bacterium]